MQMYDVSWYTALSFNMTMQMTPPIQGDNSCLCTDLCVHMARFDDEYTGIVVTVAIPPWFRLYWRR